MEIVQEKETTLNYGLMSKRYSDLLKKHGNAKVAINALRQYDYSLYDIYRFAQWMHDSHPHTTS